MFEERKVAVVTGATRGVGKGVATALAAAGFEVFALGRTITSAAVAPGVTPIVCDMTRDDAVADAFERVERERGCLDVLANCAWGGYERMVEEGTFTWALPFWQQPLWRWEAMMTVSVRGALVASQHAARMMVRVNRGLIVHISHWAAQKHIGSLLYGVSKAATDKLASDMAHELAKHGVVVVALYPGLVRTEAVLSAGVFDLSHSESPEFTGRAIAALAADPKAIAKTGRVHVVAALAQEYGFTDVDGRQPRPLTLQDV